MTRNRNARGDDPNGYDPASEALVLLLERHQARTEEAALRGAASQGAVLLRGARAVPIGVGGTYIPTLAAGTLMGFSIYTTAGSGFVTLRERDGDGQALWRFILGANNTSTCSTTQWFGPGGIALTNGLFLDTTAPVAGSVFLRAGEDA